MECRVTLRILYASKFYEMVRANIDRDERNKINKSLLAKDWSEIQFHILILSHVQFESYQRKIGEFNCKFQQFSLLPLLNTQPIPIYHWLKLLFRSREKPLQKLISHSQQIPYKYMSATITLQSIIFFYVTFNKEGTCVLTYTFYCLRYGRKMKMEKKITSSCILYIKYSVDCNLLKEATIL